MSWSARSIANTFNLDDDDEQHSANASTDPHLEPEDDSSRGGVKEDLSEITKTLTTKLWGVASFLAPPPSDHPPPSDPEPVSGIRRDFAEIGGRFRSGISKLSSNIHVSEITKLATNILQLSPEDAAEAIGVTDEVLAFVRDVTMHPDTWMEFPIEEDEDDAEDFELSDAQQEHALAVESLVPRLADLRIELCPGYMSESSFWKIYFVLLHPRLEPQAAELLSTPEIVKARTSLTHELKARSDTQTHDKPSSVPSVTQSEAVRLEVLTVEAEKTEKHPVPTEELQIVDKSVIQEEPRNETKPESQKVPSKTVMKMKQLSLFFVIFVCASLVLWNWDKTPHLTALLPPDDQPLHLFPVEVERKQDTRVKPEAEQAPPSLSTDFNTPQTSHLENTKLLVDNSISEPKELSETTAKQQSVTSQRTESTVIDTPMAKAETKACNFGKGKWVPADNRPLYSGFGCKQWLSGMWACRLTQRTDFGYEKLKWQPKDCKMDDFTGAEFLKRMQDKTLAFVGDSLGRQQFQSLMCMVTGGEEMPDVEDVGKEFGLAKAQGSARPDGWAYRFPTTNTTILYYWSASLCDIEPIDPTSETTDYAMHLDRPPAFLKHFLDRIHVLVLNTGHHWNRGKLNANRWVMYVGGKPNTNRRIADIGGAKNFTIHSVVRWVNAELPKHPGLKAFLRSISPRHFFNGEWNTGGTCDSTSPGSLEVLQDESSDPVAASGVKGTDVKLLDITGLSLVREEGHISRYSIRAAPGMQDCLHWCLPGVPDTWNELLFAQI